MADSPSDTPRARGAHLRHLVEAREPVAWRDEGGTWSWHDLEGAEAPESRLCNADLVGAKLRRADLTRANLDGSSLRIADLRDTVLTEGLLRGADLFRARLDGANLSRTSCARASFWGASLCQVDLREARCRNADFRQAKLVGVKLEHTVLSGALLDATAYERSAWAPADLIRWLDAGAKLVDPDALPVDAREALAARSDSGPELCLFFPRTLPFQDKALVEALLATFLAHEGPHCQSHYQPLEQGGALVRLSGLPLEELIRAADGLSSFFANPHEPALEQALVGAVDRAIERRLPEVVARAVAPMAVLQAQLGQQILAHIDGVYSEVERTEIRLSQPIAEALRRIEAQQIEAQLDRTGWSFDATAGRLVRSGGWAVGTGAAGNALWAFLTWAATHL